MMEQPRTLDIKKLSESLGNFLDTWSLMTSNMAFLQHIFEHGFFIVRMTIQRIFTFLRQFISIKVTQVIVHRSLNVCVILKIYLEQIELHSSPPNSDDGDDNDDENDKNDK